MNEALQCLILQVHDKEVALGQKLKFPWLHKAWLPILLWKGSIWKAQLRAWVELEFLLLVWGLSLGSCSFLLVF